MTDSLVTFETAKLAKEKGFQILIPHAYIGDTLFTNEVDLSNADFTGYEHSVELDEFNINWNKKHWVFDKKGGGCLGCKLDNKKYFNGYSAPS